MITNTNSAMASTIHRRGSTQGRGVLPSSVMASPSAFTDACGFISVRPAETDANNEVFSVGDAALDAAAVVGRRVHFTLLVRLKGVLAPNPAWSCRAVQSQFPSI